MGRASQCVRAAPARTHPEERKARAGARLQARGGQGAPRRGWRSTGAAAVRQAPLIHKPRYPLPHAHALPAFVIVATAARRRPTTRRARLLSLALRVLAGDVAGTLVPDHAARAPHQKGGRCPREALRAAWRVLGPIVVDRQASEYDAGRGQLGCASGPPAPHTGGHAPARSHRSIRDPPTRLASATGSPFQNRQW